MSTVLLQGMGYGAVPGFGVGAGDMTGVGGEEKWIDNKMNFQPIEPPVKVSQSTTWLFSHLLLRKVKSCL
jgi:hypothetical protein